MPSQLLHGFRALRVFAVAVAGVVVVAGCASTPQRTTREMGETADDESVGVQLHLDSDEAKLKNGRDLAALGDWTKALSQFDAIYSKQSAKPELRAQALYQSALVHSNALNPRRDPVRATAAARTLLKEFPKSEWRDEAEALIESIDPAPPQP